MKRLIDKRTDRFAVRNQRVIRLEAAPYDSINIAMSMWLCVDLRSTAFRRRCRHSFRNVVLPPRRVSFYRHSRRHGRRTYQRRTQTVFTSTQGMNLLKKVTVANALPLEAPDVAPAVLGCFGQICIAHAHKLLLLGFGSNSDIAPPPIS